MSMQKTQPRKYVPHVLLEQGLRQGAELVQVILEGALRRQVQEDAQGRGGKLR